MPCSICNGKRYLICVRSDDGRRAVERCDECSWFGEYHDLAERPTGHLDDEDAAALAQRDGIACEPHYPCYLLEATK